MIRSKVSVLVGLLLGGLSLPAVLSANPGSTDLEQELMAQLERAESGRQARQLVEALNAIGSDACWEALGKHLARRGPAEEEALDALWLSGSSVGHAFILARAAKAAPDDPLSLESIRIAALIPGESAVRLLERLSTDWSEEVQEAAFKALALRARAGLATETAIKEVPLDVGFLPQRGTQSELPEGNEKNLAQISEGVRMRRREERARLSEEQRDRFFVAGPDAEGRSGSQPRPRTLAQDLVKKSTQAPESKVTANSQEDRAPAP